jgi:hypothetical protein
MSDAAKLHSNPEMHLRDGRVIGTFADAIAIAIAIAIMREHESRPGVDDRDEVLHRLERAHSDKQRAGQPRPSSPGQKSWISSPHLRNPHYGRSA